MRDKQRINLNTFEFRFEYNVFMKKFVNLQIENDELKINVSNLMFENDNLQNEYENRSTKKKRLIKFEFFFLIDDKNSFYEF